MGGDQCFSVTWGADKYDDEGNIIGARRKGKREELPLDVALAEFLKRQADPYNDWVLLASTPDGLEWASAAHSRLGPVPR